MTVYRKERKVNPLLVGLLVVAAAAVIALGVLFVRNRTAQAPADPLVNARAQAQEAAQGLDIFTIEYPQAAQGAERSGALDGLARARATFQAVQDDLTQIDANLVAQIAADFETLEQKAEAGAPAEEIVPLADETRRKLLTLAGSGSP